VDVTVRDNTFKFKVMNAVPATEAPQVLSGGIGLLNVRKRLNLLYPDRHELKTMREGETFLVSLTIQLEIAVAPPVRSLVSEEPISLQSKITIP
jgi:LytS/YehU family sensor histidine kinase